MRTSKDEYFLDIAKRCAQQGTCLRRNFGSVIVDPKTNTIVSTGYTGAAVGEPHCKTCWREDNNIPSGSNYEKCRSIHSEQNAMIQAGKKAKGCVLYLTGIDMKTGNESDILPCFLCAKMLMNSGITHIIQRNKRYTVKEIYDIREKEALG